MYDFVFIDGVVVIAGPPGYKVNLAHPTQRHNVIAYVLFAISVPLSALCLAQFIYVKLRILRRVDAQLTCLVLGWLSSIVIATIQVSGYATKVTGVHIWEMPVTRAMQGAKMLVVVTALNAFTTGLCKTSLGLSYYHISPKTWWKWANGASIFLMASYNIAIFLLIILGCRPIEKNWSPYTPGVCINQPALYIARAALGVLSDLVLLILPVPMVVKLQVPTRQKIAVVVFFAIGATTLVTAALRVGTLKPTLHSLDHSWEYSSTGLITLSESQLIVICAALPTMKQFFACITPSLIGEGSSSANSSEPSRHRNEPILHSLKTIGGIVHRAKVDEFGLAIDDDDSCTTMIPAQDDSRNDYTERRSFIYDNTWLEFICDESFKK